MKADLLTQPGPSFRHTRRLSAAIASLLLAVSQAPAFAHTITGDITCDNQFAIYTAASEGLGMTLNYAGFTGCHPTEVPISINTPDRYLYIACWSDNGVAQGLVHDLVIDGQPVFSQDPRWRVTYTDEDYDPICPAIPGGIPTKMVATIPAPPGGWLAPTVGCVNVSGCLPVWGSFLTIDATARRVWYDSGTQVSADAPFFPGFNHREFLIFRIDMGPFEIACPTSAACAGDTLRLGYCVKNPAAVETPVCVHAEIPFTNATYDTTFLAGPGEEVCFTWVVGVPSTTPAGPYTASMTAFDCSDTTRRSTCVSSVTIEGISGRFGVSSIAGKSMAHDDTVSLVFQVRNESECPDSLAYELKDTKNWITDSSSPLSGRAWLLPDEEFNLVATIHSDNSPILNRDTLKWTVEVHGTRDSSRTIVAAMDENLVGAPSVDGGSRIRFGQPTPNPARGSFRISAEIPRSSRVVVRIIDISGRVVGTLGDRYLPPGRHDFVWPGLTRLSGGFYRVVLDADGTRLSRPLIVVR